LEQACSLWISQKTAESNGAVNVWMSTALDKIGDQLSEVTKTLSQSRILAIVGSAIFIGLLAVFLYSGNQSSKSSRAVTHFDQLQKEVRDHPANPDLSKATLPPEKPTLSSVGETPKKQINTADQQAKEHPNNSPTGTQQHINDNRPEDLNTAINNRLLSENDDSATTASCFRVAKEMMSSSKLITAKKKYEECFTQNATYLDTILDYQKLLNALEGYQGARITYKNLIQTHNNTTLVFAELLFDESKARYPKMKKFLEINPGYSLAYYWLGMDCYEVSGSDEVCKGYLQNFLDVSKSGNTTKFFVNSQRLKVMIEEATSKFGGK
jgi:tetratricopeptide (TPR) repeat protein